MDPIQALVSVIIALVTVVLTLAGLFRYWLPRHSPPNQGLDEVLQEVRRMREADAVHHAREEEFWNEVRRTLARLEGRS